jgi:hypothetical protein
MPTGQKAETATTEEVYVNTNRNYASNVAIMRFKNIYFYTLV